MRERSPSRPTRAGPGRGRRARDIRCGFGERRIEGGTARSKSLPRQRNVAVSGVCRIHLSDRSSDAAANSRSAPRRSSICRYRHRGPRCSAPRTSPAARPAPMDRGTRDAPGSRVPGRHLLRGTRGRQQQRVATTRLVRMRLLLLLARRGEPLDEAPRHISFDHDFPVRRHVAEHAGDTIHPRDLLAIEILAAVERHA